MVVLNIAKWGKSHPEIYILKTPFAVQTEIFLKIFTSLSFQPQTHIHAVKSSRLPYQKESLSPAAKQQHNM